MLLAMSSAPPPHLVTPTTSLCPDSISSTAPSTSSTIFLDTLESSASTIPGLDILSLTPVDALSLLGDTVDMLMSDADELPTEGLPAEVNLRSVSAERGRVISRRNSERDLKAQGTEPPATPTDSPPENRHDERQLAAITRRFFSKKPSPIPPTIYLARLHKYCAHSAAVYLWLSTTLFRLVRHEGVLTLGKRNVHRVLLAGLDVASKALEDHSWAHARMAQVGGVCGEELTRLEVGFCFLCDFELQVGAERLKEGGEEVWSVVQSWRGERKAESLEMVGDAA